LSAAWDGFDDGESSVSYQWAVISEELATSVILASGEQAEESVRCRTVPGFEGSPDILDWQTTEDTFVRVTNLMLTLDTTYYVVIRAENQAGQILFTNSDGVRILEHHLIERAIQQKKDNPRKRDNSRKSNDSRKDDKSTASSSGSSSSSSNDDDDDGLADWEIGLIAAGCALFCLLLLLLLLIGISFGKGEDKYQTTVHRNENVERI